MRRRFVAMALAACATMSAQAGELVAEFAAGQFGGLDRFLSPPQVGQDQGAPRFGPVPSTRSCNEILRGLHNRLP